MAAAGTGWAATAVVFQPQLASFHFLCIKVSKWRGGTIVSYDHGGGSPTLDPNKADSKSSRTTNSWRWSQISRCIPSGTNAEEVIVHFNARSETPMGCCSLHAPRILRFFPPRDRQCGDKALRRTRASTQAVYLRALSGAKIASLLRAPWWWKTRTSPLRL